MRIRNAMSKIPGYRALALALSLSAVGLLIGARSDAGAHDARAQGHIDGATTKQGSALPPAPNASGAAAVAGASRYTVTEILLPYRLAAERLSINSSGDVAGTLEKPGGNVAFYYHAGQTTILDEASGRDGKTEAIALNDHGQVLLERYRSDHHPEQEALIWKDGLLTTIGPVPTPLSPGWSRAPVPKESVQAIPNVSAIASGINNSGQVVGYLLGQPFGFDGGIPTRPFVWQGGVLTTLDNGTSPLMFRMKFVPFVVLPAAINEKCEIVGSGDDGGGQTGPRRTVVVLWDSKSVRTVEVRSQYDKGGPDSVVLSSPIHLSDPIQPYAINNHGVWVGDRKDTTWPHACFGSGKTNDIHDLNDGSDGSREIAATLTSGPKPPKCQSTAFGINDSGQIVGTVSTFGGAGDQAYLWQDGGGKGINLNDMIDKKLGIHLDKAYGINNAGQIVAIGERVPPVDNSGYHAYILTPIKK